MQVMVVGVKALGSWRCVSEIVSDVAEATVKRNDHIMHQLFMVRWIEDGPSQEVELAGSH